MNKVEADDTTRQNWDVNTRYKYSTDGLEHPSGLYLLKFFCKEVGFNTPDKQIDLYDNALETVQFFSEICIVRE